jgi:hypothetical protein
MANTLMILLENKPQSKARLVSHLRDGLVFLRTIYNINKINLNKKQSLFSFLAQSKQNKSNLSFSSAHAIQVVTINIAFSAFINELVAIFASIDYNSQIDTTNLWSLINKGLTSPYEALTLKDKTSMLIEFASSLVEQLELGSMTFTELEGQE